jgi:hypothetical protein
MLLANSRGGYSFLKGGGPYAAGVIAASGFVIEHVRLAKPIPWQAGFELVDAQLAAAGRPRAALCAIGLRSPAPFSFAGFVEFNRGYIEVLKSWDIMVDGINPVARTNIAPERDPPSEPSLYSFGYTVPAEAAAVSLLVAGAGEIPDGTLDPKEVVRAGETSPEAMAEKTRFVMDMMQTRIEGLGATWDDVDITNVYTVHDVGALLPTEVLPRMGRAGLHGVTLQYSRPPIVSLEYEMDVRGGTRERRQ